MHLLRVSVSLLAFAAVAAAQTTVHVTPSTGIPLIQQILSTSPPNTTVVFAPGRYDGALTVTQDIVLQGAGAATTTIDATVLTSSGLQVSTLSFVPGITRNTVVSGFTLTGGHGAPASAAPATGGGVDCLDAAPIVRLCTITGNTANEGGGVRVQGQLATNGRSLLMEDCIIRGNGDPNNIVNRGGGVFVDGLFLGAGSPANFVRCEIADNLASSGGGVGIYGFGVPVFDHCIVRNNRALDGGGFHWREGCAPLITGCSVQDNTADFAGGGIFYMLSGAAIIEHTSVVGNEAVAQGVVAGGGGMNGAIDGPATVTVRNCLFAKNRSGLDGGGILLVNSAPVLRFVTIVDNHAAGSTGGLRFRYRLDNSGFPFLPRFQLRNSIVWGNQDGVLGSTFADNLNGTDVNPQPVLPTIDFCDVQQFGVAGNPLFAGPGNIDADPLFVAGYTCKWAPDGSYFLAQVPEGISNNPCVDTASLGPAAPAIVGRSTRTDGRPDGGVFADRGFHYPVPGCP